MAHSEDYYYFKVKVKSPWRVKVLSQLCDRCEWRSSPFSMAPSQQCATVLPATRYRRTCPCLVYGKRASPPHITAVTFPAVKLVPICTAWWTEARVWTTCPRLLPGSALAQSQTCNLRDTSLARYRYTTKPYLLLLLLPVVCGKRSSNGRCRSNLTGGWHTVQTSL